MEKYWIIALVVISVTALVLQYLTHRAEIRRRYQLLQETRQALAHERRCEAGKYRRRRLVEQTRWLIAKDRYDSKDPRGSTYSPLREATGEVLEIMIRLLLK